MKLQSLLESIKEAAPKDSIYGIFVNGKDSTARFSDYAQASDLLKQLKKRNPKNDYEVKQADPKRISEGEERSIIQHACTEKLQNYFSGREFEYESKDDLEYDIYQALEKLNVEDCVDPKMKVGGQPIENFASGRVIGVISASDVIYDVMNALDLSQIQQPVEENIFKVGALAAMLGMSASALAQKDIVSDFNDKVESTLQYYEQNPNSADRNKLENEQLKAALRYVGNFSAEMSEINMPEDEKELLYNLRKLFLNPEFMKDQELMKEKPKWNLTLERNKANNTAKMVYLAVKKKEKEVESEQEVEVKENLNDDMIGQPDDYYDEEERKEAYADLQDALQGNYMDDYIINGACPACGGNGYMDGEEEVYNDETDEYEEGTECDGFGIYGCDQGEMTGASWVEIIQHDKRNAERQKTTILETKKL